MGPGTPAIEETKKNNEIKAIQRRRKSLENYFTPKPQPKSKVQGAKEKLYYEGDTFNFSEKDERNLTRRLGSDKVIKGRLKKIDDFIKAGKFEDARKKAASFNKDYKSKFNFSRPIREAALQQEKFERAPERFSRSALVQQRKEARKKPAKPSETVSSTSTNTQQSDEVIDKREAAKQRGMTKKLSPYGEARGRRAIQKIFGEDTKVEYEDMDKAGDLKKGGLVKSKKSKYGMKAGGFTSRGTMHRAHKK